MVQTRESGRNLEKLPNAHAWETERDGCWRNNPGRVDMTHFFEAIRSTVAKWAGLMKRDTLTVWIAARDPITPWRAKVLAAAVAAYALSPIDLIPDFIPVLGWLDDLLIVPLGIWLVLKLLPPDVLVRCRAKAEALTLRPMSRAGFVAILLTWCLVATAVALLVLA